MRGLIETLCSGVDLSEEESQDLFGRIINGDVSEVELSAILVALKAKGESPAELAGAARALRNAALPFPAPSAVFADSCGTGGDGASTINISTAVAFVAAAGGLPMAKHGNRSVSSRCGSADVLEILGARIDAPPEVSRQSLDEVGFCFLFAPQYHPGLRHAMPVRRALKVRTLINLLGPLVNPSRPPVQVMGISDPRLIVAAAETLRLLGTTSALVVHGSGLDEMALHGPTCAALLRDGSISQMELVPENFGLTRVPLDALRGGAPEENAALLVDVLRGSAPRPHIEAVAWNTGALFWLAGLSKDLLAGVEKALEILNSEAAYVRLQRFIEASHG